MTSRSNQDSLPLAAISTDDHEPAGAEWATQSRALAAPDESRDTTDLRRGSFNLKERLLNVRALLSFALAFALLGITIWKAEIDLSAIWQRLQTLNPLLYSLAFVVFYATFPLRSLRWRTVLRSAGFPVDDPDARQRWSSLPALTEFLGLSWFANCIVPAKLGDAYRGYLLKRNGQVSFSRTFGTIFAERIIDMLVLFTLMVISGATIFGTRLTRDTRLIFIFGLLLVILIVVGLIAMRYMGPQIRRILPNRLHEFYGRFEEGTLASFQLRTLPGLLALTALIWLGEAARLYLVIEAMGGLGVTLPAVIFIALASSLLTTVPALPGGLGLVELGITGVLVLFQIDTADAFATATLDRLINFWSIVIFGFILYTLSKRK